MTSASLLCILAIADMPYGYYTFLRIVITSSAIFGAISLRSINPWFTWICILIAILFNPVLPVYFNRGIWRVIDVLTAVILVAAAVKISAGMCEEKI
jgi:arginine exporter protein ArgO